MIFIKQKQKLYLIKNHGENNKNKLMGILKKMVNNKLKSMDIGINN